MFGSVRKHGFFIALAALGLAACAGGGSGTPSSQSTATTQTATPTQPTAPTISGIEGTGRTIVSKGAITTLGNIVVNGVAYSTDRAAIQVNGRSAAAGELLLGQVVTVAGTLNADNTTAVANTVTFSAPLVGPVQSIDAANATIVVLGQSVQIDGTTKFAANVSATTAADLAVGTELQISGFRDSRGLLAARSVDRRAAGQSYVATGDAAAVDNAGQRLNIGSLVVAYSGATLEGFGGRQPANADFIRAEGLTITSSGALQATRLALVDRHLPAQTGNTGHLQGWVTRFASVTDFDVDGVAITTDTATKFNSVEAGGFGGLRIDRFVNVTGVLLADGRLLAGDVVTNNLVTINAQILGISPYEVEYSTVNQRCQTAGTTYTVDGRSATWSAVKPGDIAILYQSFGRDIPTRCPIVSVNRTVRGPVDSIDLRRGRLVVMGQSVTVTGTTQVFDVAGSRTVDALTQLQPGTVVEVSGYRSAAGTVVATRVGVPAAGTVRQVMGVVAGLDTSARRFSVGGLIVDYSGAAPSGFPGEAVQTGQRVIVRGSQSGAGVLQASEFEYDSPNLRGAAVGAAHVVGPITRFASVNDFDIEGRQVMPAPDNNVVIGPGPTCGEEHLGLDAFITAITAAQPVAGFQAYARVRLSHDIVGGQDTVLSGRVDSVDVVSRTLVVGGLEVALHGLTKLRNHAAGTDPTCGAALDLSALRPGDGVRISGSSGPGHQTLIASNLDRFGPSSGAGLVQITGRIDSLGASEFVVNGTRVRWSPTTAFPNCEGGVINSGDLSAAEFMQLSRQQMTSGVEVNVTVEGLPGAAALDVLGATAVRGCLPSGERTGLIRGTVDSINTAAGQIVVFGIPMQIGAAPLAVTVGQYVEVDVRWRPLRNSLVAEAVRELQNVTTKTPGIDGVPDRFGNPNVVVFGRSIATNASTVFMESGTAIDAATFFGHTWDSYRFELTGAAGGGMLATRIDVSFFEVF